MPDSSNGQDMLLSSTQRNQVDQLYANMIEQTFFKSPYVADSYKTPYNPDDLYQKKFDYSIYESMLVDDQVSVCMRLKKDLILGDGANILSQDEEQEEIIEDIKQALFEDYEGNFVDDLEELLTSYDFGFSLSEKIFKIRESGKLGIKSLKTRHPNSWLIYQDDHGNITKFEQKTNHGSLDVDRKSLIHIINDKRFQNPYGTSDLRSAYNAWIAKLHVTRFFSIYLEKAASPIPVGKYDKNSPSGFSEKLLNVLKTFQTKTAISVSKDVEIEFLEAKTNGEAYHKAIHLFNMIIGRSLFVPDLVGFTGSETGGGSLALGKEQMNLFFMHIYRRRNSLEDVINKEIIKPIINYNFGFVENPPKFKFKPLDESQAVELAKVWLDAVKGNAYQPNEEEINHFRKLVKFPEGEVEFKQLQAQPQGQPNEEEINHNMPKVEAGSKVPTGQKISDTALNGAQVTALVEVVEAVAVGRLPRESAVALIESAFLVDKSEAEKILGSAGKGFVPKDLLEQQGLSSDLGQKKFKLQEMAEKNGYFAKAYDQTPGDYHKKVNFKAMKTKLDDYDKSLMNETEPIVRKMLMDLKDQIEKKKIIQNQNVDKIDGLSLKYKKELKQVFKNSFQQLYRDSQVQAKTEVTKSNFAKPLEEDKWLEVIDKEVFNFIGDYEYSILKNTRVELIAAIKDGRPLSSVLGILDDKLNELSEVQLERYARTKHTEVMNNARHDYFESTGVVTGYQYSAIMDDRTSEICSGLHGKFFKSGTEPIPPMHFNCRSTLIPITKYEEFKPTESIRGEDPQKFIEDNKGSGFSKYTNESENKIIIKQKQPSIDDDGVEIESTYKDNCETIKYSLNGIVFQETNIVYEDDKRDKIKSLKHKKINNE